MSLKALIGAVSVLSIATIAWGPTRAQERGAEKPSSTRPAPAQSVGRLIEQLKRHPVPPKPAALRFGLHLMDLNSGEVTLIADQPAPGLTYCGSPAWSHDGRRILYDATPGNQWVVSRLKAIELVEGRLTVTDLGTGNCPTFSPADDRIAFLSNAEGVPTGIWLMNADGSGRRHLGDYGIPKWSPDGRHMMIITFGEPRQLTIMDADPERSGIVSLPDDQNYSIPSWAEDGTIVAIIGATAGDQIALIDVRTPARARVKQVLWKRANDRDPKPTCPIYSTAARRCIFSGADVTGESLYSIQPGEGARPKRMGQQPPCRTIVDLALSPDGRYVLFSARDKD
jgi:Tol biopolymer transport system component